MFHPEVHNVSQTEKISSVQEMEDFNRLKFQLFKLLFEKFNQCLEPGQKKPSLWDIQKKNPEDLSRKIGIVDLRGDPKAKEIIDFLCEDPSLATVLKGNPPYLYEKAEEPYKLMVNELKKLTPTDRATEIAVIELFDATFAHLDQNKVKALKEIQENKEKIKLLNAFSAKLSALSGKNGAKTNTADFREDQEAKNLVDQLLQHPEFKAIVHSDTPYLYEGVPEKTALISTQVKQMLSDVSYQSSLIEEFSQRQRMITDVARDLLKHAEEEKRAHLRVGSPH